MPESISIASPLAILLVVALATTIVVAGRNDVALGMWLAWQNWAYLATVGQQTPLFRILVGVLLAATVSNVVWRVFRKELPALSGVLRRPVMLVLGWAVWVFLASWPPQSEIGRQMLIFAIGYGMATAFAVALLAADPFRVLNVLWTMSACTVVAGLAAISEAGSQGVEALLYRGPLTGFGSVNYTLFAQPIAAATVFVSAAALCSNGRVQRLAGGVMALSLGGLLAMSGSRQNVLGAILGVSAVLVTARKSKRGRTVAGIPRPIRYASVGAAALSVAYILSQTTLWEERLAPEQLKGVAGRDVFMAMAWRTFLENPLAGAGVSYSENGEWAHNAVLDVAAGQGVVGLVLFFAVLVSVGRRTLRLARSAPRIAPEGRTIVCTAMGLYVSALTAGAVNAITSIPSFFLVAGLIGEVEKYQAAGRAVGPYPMPPRSAEATTDGRYVPKGWRRVSGMRSGARGLLFESLGRRE